MINHLLVRFVMNGELHYKIIYHYNILSANANLCVGDQVLVKCFNNIREVTALFVSYNPKRLRQLQRSFEKNKTVLDCLLQAEQLDRKKQNIIKFIQTRKSSKPMNLQTEDENINALNDDFENVSDHPKLTNGDMENSEDNARYSKMKLHFESELEDIIVVMEEQHELVSFGPNKTSIRDSDYKSIDWKHPAIATHTLLKAAFSRQALASHRLTKRKVVCKNPLMLRPQLDEHIIEDIIAEICKNCEITPESVRLIIDVVCAEEFHTLISIIQRNRNVFT